MVSNICFRLAFTHPVVAGMLPFLSTLSEWFQKPIGKLWKQAKSIP